MITFTINTNRDKLSKQVTKLLSTHIIDKKRNDKNELLITYQIPLSVYYKWLHIDDKHYMHGLNNDKIKYSHTDELNVVAE